MNETAFEISGYERDELIGKSLDELPDLIPEEDRQKTIERFGKMIEGEEVPPITVPLNLKDGATRYFEMKSVPIGEGEDIRGIIGIARDITARRDAQEKKDFLHSLLRHDMRNKAQIAQGYLDLLSNLDISDEGQKYIEKASKSIQESFDLIEKVRTLRKVEEAEFFEDFDLDSLIKNVISNYEAKISENDIEIDYERIGCTIKGMALVEEIFSNLIENSIRHSCCDLIRISSEISNGRCCVTIEDDGKGVPDNVKDRIFDKNYKGDESSGTGLGLYLVQRIVETVSGEITVRDSELGGARFDIWFNSNAEKSPS